VFYYYRSHKKIFFSKFKIDSLAKIVPENLRLEENKYIYYLQKRDWQNTSSLAALIHPEQIGDKKQEINILRKPEGAGQEFSDFPDWIVKKINNREVGLCNYNHPRWKERLDWAPPEQWNVSIVGLGRVGGTLLIALRSMGGEKIKKIGIFDTNEKSLSRWEQEANQIIDGSGDRRYPTVKILKSEEIFQADLVICCISMGDSESEQGVKDIRKFQLEANSRIIDYYAQRARKNNFNGIFAILSEPVDLLCQNAFFASNINEEGELDGKGLAADQIRGFGLGVMHGRTIYYAEQEVTLKHYLDKGRVFGPQGPGLVVIDDINHYNREKSLYLTKKVLQANTELIKIGFKPYIAPAVASGALSLLNLMERKWHYSAGFLGEIFWGSRNRQTPVGLEWEQFYLTPELLEDLNDSYQSLKKQASKLQDRNG
jgi:hypothetical protein